jgi:hypothetical protein
MQTGLELVMVALAVAVVVVVAMAAVRNGSKFSQCNMLWESFSWARVSGC